MGYKITNKTPRRETTIQGLIVNVPTPFAEGHPLTATEADALNQVFIENVRNNNARKVKAAAEDADTADLTAETLQPLIDDYCTSYEFGVRAAGGTRVSRDPVEARAYKIAGERVRAALSKQGITKKALAEKFGEGKFNELVEGVLAKDSTIRQMAVKQIEAERADIEVDLGDLNAG